MELLPVIVLVCAIFKGHKWARRCPCEMGRKREARGVKRENACLGGGCSRDAAVAATKRRDFQKKKITVVTVSSCSIM